MLAPQTLTASKRDRLRRIAGALVPGGHGMPSADDIGLCDRPIDRALTSRPDLVAPLSEAIDRLPNEPGADDLAALERTEPELFESLLQAVLGAYYLDPRIKDALGYPGQQALAIPRAGFGFEDDIEPMLAAEPRWRRVPER